MISELLYAYQTRKAWWFTATSRTRSRFARTILGSFWLGFSNLLSITTLGIVYGTVFSVSDFRSYFLYLGIGLVVWNSLASSISSSPQLFVHNAANIKNLNLKPEFYTFEEWAFQIQTFFQSFILVFIVLSFFNFNIIINLLTSIWLPLINFLVFIYWFPIVICILSSLYSDIAQLIPVVLQLVFLISPILYQKESLGKLSWITNYNFIYVVLDSVRDSIIFGVVNYRLCLFLSLINLFGVYFAFKLLRKQRRNLPFMV